MTGFYEGESDEALLARYRSGEAEVSDYLIEKYKGIVRRKARALYLIGGDTDDLIQEGMIGLFQAIRDYKPGHGATFLTYANLCVERQLIGAIQRSNRQKNLPLNSAVPLEQEETAGGLWRQSHGENPEAILIDLENRRALEERIASELSPMEREVLSLYLDGESYTRIGALLGKPEKSVDNAIQRIRRKLRRNG